LKGRWRWRGVRKRGKEEYEKAGKDCGEEREGKDEDE
jgi:hypothetical protein